MLWSLKYEPTKSGQYLGNRKQLEIVKKWILHIKRKNTVSYKPLIIQGDVSVGKTCFAKLILKSNKFFIINFDYDLFAEKKKITVGLSRYLQPNTIEKTMFKKTEDKSILIEDIDSDKTLCKDLITFIKDNKDKLTVPIVITCNKNKLKILHKYCTVITLYPPTNVNLFKYGKRIITNENLNVDDASLQYFIKQCQRDYRQLASLLYYVYLDPHKNENDNESESDNEECSVDLSVSFAKKFKAGNLYEICNTSLNHYSNLTTVYNYCCAEKTLSGLMFHENYLNTIIKNRKGSLKKKITIAKDISETLSIADFFRTQVIVNKIGWELEPYSIILENVIPSYILNKKIDKYSANRDNNINFTKLLSNNSVSYNNYTMINSVIIFEKIGCDFQILVDILLNNLFLETGNRDLAFNIISRYGIQFDTISKLITFRNRDTYKKLFTKRRKQKIMDEYNSYVINSSQR